VTLAFGDDCTGAKYGRVKIKVALRPIVNRPVTLGVKPHLGPQDQIFYYSQTVAVPSMWGVLSHNRKGLSFFKFIAEIRKEEVHLSKIYKFSSYLTGNTLRLRYKDQPVNAV
jgi:hypothetical protein